MHRSLSFVAPAIALLASVSFAQGDWSAFQAPPRRVDVVVPTPGQEGATITLETDAGPLTLALAPASVRAADAVCYVDAGTGQLERQPLPPPATFSGFVSGLPGSVVGAGVVRGGLRAVIDLDGPGGDEDLLYVQPAADFGGGEGHVVYRASELLARDFRCGGALEAPMSAPGGYGSRECSRVAEIAFDADYYMYQGNGSSVSGTVADIESVLIAMNTIYARDVGIEHQSTAYVVRTVLPDPYTATDAGGILDQFRVYWTNNHAGVRRDVAHLMTGREVDGNVIGVAWVGVVCNGGYGFGLSQSLFTTDMAGRVGLTAHEVGHNWSASHCDGDADCSIMCSGIGGCAGNLSALSSRTITEITNFRNGSSCLTTGGPVPHADELRMLPGQSARVDVLGNDSDAACASAISLFSFDSRTLRGGTVTRSAGTGPGGRDELLITEPGTVSGDDQVGYVIRNTSGFSAAGRVFITVTPPRPADTVALTSPGLSADYYHTLPHSVAEIPLGRVVGTGGAATIDFASSDAPIAGGTRAVGVGLVLTGTINIPTAGTYTFFTESDDGSSLYVNNGLVVLNDGPQGMTEVGGLVTLPAGPASVRVEYTQGAGGAGLIARVSGPGVPKQVIPAAWWTGGGVSITYLALGDAYGDLPNFSTLTSARHDVVPVVNMTTPPVLGSGRYTDVAAVLTGYFQAPTTGIYKFYLASDDASEMRIGSTVVVTNRGAHGISERSGTAVLAAGRHAVRIEYWQGASDAALIASMEGPNLAKQVIPASMWSHEVTDCNGDGVNDFQQAFEGLNLGDIAVGGNGRGTGTVRAGINPMTGRVVQPTALGGNRASGASIFFALDGVNGRANIPMVEGVFVPNGLTTIAAGLPQFAFSRTTGGGYDAVRNGGALFVSPAVTQIVLADAPTTSRGGLGMHANSGITFDLNAVRAANPGRAIARVSGTAGPVRDSCAGQGAGSEFWVLVDGATVYRTVIDDDSLARGFDVPVGDGAAYLTFAMLDAGGNSCDHMAVADATLWLGTSANVDGDPVLDECQCAADFNRDGGVDGGDVEAFFAAWENSEPSADTNRDGGIDGGDVEAFYAVWQQGGC